jgi:hypothetical protein
LSEVRISNDVISAKNPRMKVANFFPRSVYIEKTATIEAISDPPRSLNIIAAMAIVKNKIVTTTYNPLKRKMVEI